MARVGLGQDSHRFSDDPHRRLVLGGVVVEGERGLDGASDADVVLHALCRALEQAIGNDDFSTFADEMSRRGIDDSARFVEVSRTHVAARGFRIVNVGITIEAQVPRIAPIRDAMKSRIATLLGIAREDVGINASTGDALTDFGRGAGIQAFAIVSVEPR